MYFGQQVFILYLMFGGDYATKCLLYLCDDYFYRKYLIFRTFLTYDVCIKLLGFKLNFIDWFINYSEYQLLEY